MILVDVELRGNVARLYYGPNSVKPSYHGDDWNDRPLNNCGMVYDEYVSGYVDMGFDLGHRLLDPEQDWRYNGDVPYCKNDFKARTAPCAVLLPPEVAESDWDACYSRYMGTEKGVRFYYGDDMDMLVQNLERHGGVVLKKSRRK